MGINENGDIETGNGLICIVDNIRIINNEIVYIERYDNKYWINITIWKCKVIHEVDELVWLTWYCHKIF